MKQRRKQWLSLLLLLAMAISLCGCGMKQTIQDKVYELLNGITGSELTPPENGGDTEDKGGIGNNSAAGNKGNSDGDKRPIASLPEGATYREKLEYEWLNAPEEGYVWTISIDDTDTINVMGLCTATYNVHLSASHIGPDMYGAYFGEFSFDYSADLGGMESLFTLQGGSMDYDTDGWFENKEFVFALYPYDAEEEEMLIAVVQHNSEYEQMTDLEKSIMDSMLGQVYDLDNEKDFEKNSTAEAMWWDYDMPMTDGDMSGYLQMNGVLGGMLDANSEVDKSGKVATADAHVAFGLYGQGKLLYVFDERYSTTDYFENPMPHTIKVYPDGQVVLSMYSAQGGPVVTKCYGTIDKIPVEDTQVPNR